VKRLRFTVKNAGSEELHFSVKWLRFTLKNAANATRADSMTTETAPGDGDVFETVSVDVPSRKTMVNETLVFEDGFVLAPTAPGLGVEPDKEACARFPYASHDVPFFNESINVSGAAGGAVMMNERSHQS
jgi:hypothetical protein